MQPFIAIGRELQNFGHRVRLATHGTFKDLVENNGLEFFDIGGDPAELMAYMVRNPGLLPSYQSLQDNNLGSKRATMRNIMERCWLSCYERSGLDSEPFVADAIIANPPSFAHVHCAQKLSIPLHIVFTYGALIFFRRSDIDRKIPQNAMVSYKSVQPPTRENSIH